MQAITSAAASSLSSTSMNSTLDLTVAVQGNNGATNNAPVLAEGHHAAAQSLGASNGDPANDTATEALAAIKPTAAEKSGENETTSVVAVTTTAESSTASGAGATNDTSGVPAASASGANENGSAGAGENKQGAEQPRRKRTRRGGWDTPAAPVPAVSVIPVNPLQELQRKLAEEQVAAAMGQAPPVTSVSAGAAALGLTMGTLPPATARAPAPAPPVQDNPKRIYIGSLHYDIKESDIAAIFGAFGEVKMVDMSHDPITDRHKGFCFIEFGEVSAAENALAAMNGFELAGRAIKVGKPHVAAAAGAPGAESVVALPAAMQLPGMAAFMAQRSAAAAAAAAAAGAAPGAGASVAAAQLKAAMASTAPPQTKIYVGNVEPHITTEMIKNVFQPFGIVVGAEMVPDPNNPGHHKGFGFIQYAQESVAKTAMETMANFELAGRCLRVAWAQDQSKPAMSVLPPGLTAAAAAAQAAAAAAKAAGGAAAAAVAARMTASGQLQAALGSAPGTGSANGVSGTVAFGGTAGGGTLGVGAAAAGVAPATAAAQRAELMRRIAEARMQGAVGSAGAANVAAGASKCVCFTNMLGPEDAEDQETKADILEEARTCGVVEQFHVHQQRASGGTVVAVRVFVAYTSPTEASMAIRKMHGRFFAGRQVRAVGYDYNMFSSGMLDA